MERRTIDQRVNWQGEVQNLGYDFHTPAGIQSWSENACYVLSYADVDRLTQAALEVKQRIGDATDTFITNGLFPLFGIDADVGRRIKGTWDQDIPAILGRFDFVYDGIDEPKLIDYNADVTTNLFETAVVQKNWRNQRFPGAGQFNRLEDALTERWRQLRVGNSNNQLHVIADQAIPEDVETVRYIGACAAAAGYAVKFLSTKDIGTFEGNFYDLQDQVMTQVYKQYAWDLFQKDDDFALVDYAKCWWLEPMWKMPMHCKGLLAHLWDMFPEHQNLLPAFTMSGMIAEDFVKKPWWGVDGQGIEIVIGNQIVERTGSTGRKYTNDGYIYQGLGKTVNLDGHRPVFGVWIVCDDVCGLGIREATGLITTHSSRFVPHIIE